MHSRSLAHLSQPIGMAFDVLRKATAVLLNLNAARVELIAELSRSGDNQAQHQTNAPENRLTTRML
jgi:hypothetical protein